MTIYQIGKLLDQVKKIQRELEFLHLGLSEKRTECDAQVVAIVARRIEILSQFLQEDAKELRR